MAVGYTGPILNYFNGAGASNGMPAGTNNQNAFANGTAALYITSTLPRRDVNMYSNLSSSVGANFITRKGIPSQVAAPARIGPQPAFIPNRNGASTSAITSPY
jgi:hypothetical protein